MIMYDESGDHFRSTMSFSEGVIRFRSTCFRSLTSSHLKGSRTNKVVRTARDNKENSLTFIDDNLLL